MLKNNHLKSIFYKMQLFLKTLIIHCLITGRPIQAKVVGDEEDDDLIDSPQPTSDKALQDYVDETTQGHSEEDEDLDVPAENTKVEVRMRKKMFHDHFNDFLKLIADDSMEDINQLIYAYRDYYTFLNSWEFVKARKFGEILKNLKRAKEFQALVQFLENDDIDVFYYSEKFDDFVETLEGQTGVQKTKGSDFNAFLRDVMDVIPFRKLSRLFEKKMTADENFRNVFMDIYSDEFDELVQQLKRTDAYKAEVAKLNANGIDIQHVYMLIKSLFGLH